MDGVGHLEAERTADIVDDITEHRLGVEQGAVHIEDDRRERHQRGGNGFEHGRHIGRFAPEGHTAGSVAATFR